MEGLFARVRFIKPIEKEHRRVAELFIDGEKTTLQLNDPDIWLPDAECHEGNLIFVKHLTFHGDNLYPRGMQGRFPTVAEFRKILKNREQFQNRTWFPASELE